MIKRHNFALGITWLFILFVIPLPLIQTLAAGLPVIYSSEFQAIYYGTIAYSWMLAAIYLATKPKWLDRLIGLPDMFMIHGIISIAAIAMAYLHKTGTTSQGWIKTTGDWAFDLFLGLMIYSLIFMAGWLTSRLPFLETIKHFLEKIFRHELSVWIHRLNLIATALVFIHVLLINYITAIKPFMIWFLGYSGFVFIAYVWSKIHNEVGDTTGILQESRSLADNVIELTIGFQDHKKMNIKAGDYIFLSFPNIPGLKEPHPFSIANPPTDKNQLVLAIRGDGDFTSKLPKVPEKSKVKIMGGIKNFWKNNLRIHQL